MDLDFSFVRRVFLEFGRGCFKRSFLGLVGFSAVLGRLGFCLLVFFVVIYRAGRSGLGKGGFGFSFVFRFFFYLRNGFGVGLLLEKIGRRVRCLEGIFYKRWRVIIFVFFY